MKKILLLLLVISLSACMKNDVDELETIGYNSRTVEMIKENHIKYRVIKYGYIDYLEELLTNPEFKSEYFDDYIAFENINAQERIKLVNEGINQEKVDDEDLKFTNETYYIKTRLDRYKKMASFVDDIHDVVTLVNHNRDYEFYELELKSKLDDEILIIANKYYTLNDYVPDNLVKIDSDIGINTYLKEEAYDAYLKMNEDAKEDGMSLWITSAYRSYNKQNSLYNGYLKENTQAEVDTFSSRPGNSDHQTGLAIDIISPGYDLSTFHLAKESTWLINNAYKYGFIMRYPDGKENLTGYMYEPWHYRYVGLEVAKYIYETDITFDEYYAFFLEGV